MNTFHTINSSDYLFCIQVNNINSRSMRYKQVMVDMIDRKVIIATVTSYWYGFIKNILNVFCENIFETSRANSNNRNSFFSKITLFIFC